MFKVKHFNLRTLGNSFLKTNARTFKAYNSNKDFYSILGISSNADSKEIKAAYYKLAKLHHPDMNMGKSSELFKDINLAYEVLSDPEQKKQYDMSRRFSFYKGGSTSSNRSETNYNSYKTDYNDYYYKGQANYNWREDPFFRNFNDWYNKARQSSYSSNFSEGKPKYKTQFEEKYYQRNKDYFSSFKQGRNEEREHKKSTSQSEFAKKHFEKNKKYYETFKKSSASDERYQYPGGDRYPNEQRGFNENSPAGFFVMMFGCFMGVMLISLLFRPRRENHSVQRYKEEDRRKVDIPPFPNANFSMGTRDEHGLSDDPYARSNKYT